jgi:iron(III) transport system ATP-binding protein
VALLSLVDVTITYDETRALNGLSLEVQQGQLVALLGPSGSGKTTLLNAVAGFVEVDSGEIWLDGGLVSRPGLTVAPERRRVGVVFQSYALWPNMTVLDTVAYPLRRHGASVTEARSRARDLLGRVGLAELETRHPGQLSGGQQQRVGLARALAVEPRLFLFDEPTANLDPSLRGALQAELRQTQREIQAGGLYVTHDPAEAFAIADHVVVLRAGNLVQQGSPQEIYACPSDEWVATLTGPAAILDGRITGPGVVAFSGGSEMSCVVHSANSLKYRETRLCIRPEWVALTSPDGAASGGTVAAVRFHGPHTDYHLDTAAGRILARRPGPPEFAVGERVGWRLSAVAVV